MTEGGEPSPKYARSRHAEPYPPLSASQTSPPQGGRLGSAKCAVFACTEPGPRPSDSNRIPEIPGNLFPASRPPCHHSSTPVTGWIAYVPVQAGGRPPGACRNVRRDDGGGGAPAGSAGSRISLNGMPRREDQPSQPPDKSLPLVSGQRRPAARAGMETGLWRAALRMREGHLVLSQRPGVPALSTQGQVRVG